MISSRTSSRSRGDFLIGVVVVVGVVNIDGDGNLVATLDETSSNSELFAAAPAQHRRRSSSGVT